MNQVELLEKKQEVQKRLEYLEHQISTWPEWKQLCGSYIFEKKNDKNSIDESGIDTKE